MTNPDLADLAVPADHGGGLDAAVAMYGGDSAGWLDLSTGINPIAYPLGHVPATDWARLPDQRATRALELAACRFWNVPEQAGVLAAPGASALIARIPALMPPGRVHIPGPTYNEHARAFRANGWTVRANGSDGRVIVNPNNPTGRVWAADQAHAPFLVIDESFCDVTPEASLMPTAGQPGTLVLKSFGKFWGLAGLRLGFAIGDPALISKLSLMLGPWPVSGPALSIGRAALEDQTWVDLTRARLTQDAARLDRMMLAKGARRVGGTSLFRLYEVGDATEWQGHLARHQIWTRTFPYDACWIRLGLPGQTNDWNRLGDALKDMK